MKVAVFFNGQLRSFRRVAHSLRTNLLGPNEAVVFGAVETDREEADVRKEVEQAFAGIEIGGLLVKRTFRDREFETILTMIEGRPGLTDEIFEQCSKRDGCNWSMRYVRSSGSVLQYYQIAQAWDLLLDYERTHNMRFDICVRARWDLLLMEPLYLREFFGTPWKNDELWGRSLGSQRLFQMIENNPPPVSDYSDPCGTPAKSALEVVWTLGCEQVWIATRPVFSQLATMVYHYGRWGGKARAPFSSENFFHEFCKYQGWAHWVLYEPNNPVFNTSHPGTYPVLEDPWVFSLLR